MKHLKISALMMTVDTSKFTSTKDAWNSSEVTYKNKVNKAIEIPDQTSQRFSNLHIQLSTTFHKLTSTVQPSQWRPVPTTRSQWIPSYAPNTSFPQEASPNKQKVPRNRLINPQDPFSVRGVTFGQDPPEYIPDGPRIQRTATPHDILFNPYATSSGPRTVAVPTPDPTSYEPIRTAAQKQSDAETALPPRPVPVSKKRVCWNLWWFALC